MMIELYWQNERNPEHKLSVGGFIAEDGIETEKLLDLCRQRFANAKTRRPDGFIPLVKWNGSLEDQHSMKRPKIKTKDEVQVEFTTELQSLLNRYKAELSIERYGFEDQFAVIAVSIPSVYNEAGEHVREFCEFRLGWTV